MTDTLPEGRLLKIEMEIRLPADATWEQVDEWLRYSMNERGSISTKNPLFDFGPEPFGRSGFDWTDTRMQGRVEDRDKTIDAETGAVTYMRHYIRERPSEAAKATEARKSDAKNG